MSDERVSKFLNVDLDVLASAGIDVLVRALEKKAILMNTHEQFASFELNGSRSLTLEQTINGFIKLIESLPPDARAVWDNAKRRDMNAGFSSGSIRPVGRFEVSPETLRRMAEIGAELVISIYPREHGEPRG